MAAAIVEFNNTLDPMRTAVQALRQIRDGVAMLGNSRQVMIQACNGATNTAANFALLTTLCNFQAGGYVDANTAVLAMFGQVDTLYTILTKPSGQGDAAGAAITQACGMLGVV